MARERQALSLARGLKEMHRECMTKREDRREVARKTDRQSLVEAESEPKGEGHSVLAARMHWAVTQIRGRKAVSRREERKGQKQRRNAGCFPEPAVPAKEMPS